MVWRDIKSIRSESPLVMNITNYVVMNTTANALLALGGSPVMAHALDEVVDMVGLARSLVLNIGTLSGPWVEAMLRAGKEANRRNIPVVLDPVGCGATRYRTETVHMLREHIQFSIIRGNASEIRAMIRSDSTTKGVDSVHLPEHVRDDAVALSRAAKCVISVSGAVDLVVDGERVARIANGHSMMAQVTGMGCTASAVTGAFAAVNASLFEAATHAMVTMGVAGELAAANSQGPGSFQSTFLDALYGLTEETLVHRARVDCA